MSKITEFTDWVKRNYLKKKFKPTVLYTPYLVDARACETKLCHNFVYHRVASEMLFSDQLEIWTLPLN